MKKSKEDTINNLPITLETVKQFLAERPPIGLREQYRELVETPTKFDECCHRIRLTQKENTECLNKNYK